MSTPKLSVLATGFISTILTSAAKMVVDKKTTDAHPDFYAFWADGHGRRPSESRLYFTNREGNHVWRLPVKMTGQLAKPEIVW